MTRAAGIFFIWSAWLAAVSHSFGLRSGVNIAAPYLDLSDAPFWTLIGFITTVAVVCMLSLAWPSSHGDKP